MKKKSKKKEQPEGELITDDQIKKLDRFFSHPVKTDKDLIELYEIIKEKKGECN